jgi:hypothetical protein
MTGISAFLKQLAITDTVDIDTTPHRTATVHANVLQQHLLQCSKVE